MRWGLGEDHEHNVAAAQAREEAALIEVQTGFGQNAVSHELHEPPYPPYGHQIVFEVSQGVGL